MKKNEQDVYRAFVDTSPHQFKRDRRMMKEAVVFVTDELSKLKGKGGAVIFPAELHPRDIHSLRGHVSGVGNRLGFIVPIPVDGGMGTLIEIRERKR